MAKVSGVVDGISRKFPPKIGISVNGKWYNTNEEWLKTVPNKGDTVEFDDGGKNYIKQLKIVGGEIAPIASGGKVMPASDRDRGIIRQNALTNAVNCVTNNRELYEALDTDIDLIEAIIYTAMKFEKYTSGDMIKEAAKEAEKAVSSGFDVTDI